MIYQNAQGLGFAVSSNTAKRVIDSILKTGSVKWPYLGVKVTTMTQELANAYNIKYTEGAFVADVVAGSPAYSAGIRKYDIITAVNDKTIKTSDDLISTIRNYSPNDKVNITVSRNGKIMNFEVVLGSQ